MPSRRWNWTPSLKRPKAVESAILEVDLANMTYKDELKKREKNDASQQAVGASNTTPDKAKKSKKAEGDESPPAKVIAGKAALDEA